MEVCVRDSRRQQLKRIKTRNLLRARHGKKPGMEDGSGAVPDRMKLDSTTRDGSRNGDQLSESAGNISRTSLIVAGCLRETLHCAPDMRASQCTDALLHQWIGREVEQVASA